MFANRIRVRSLSLWTIHASISIALYNICYVALNGRHMRIWECAHNPHTHKHILCGNSACIPMRSTFSLFNSCIERAAGKYKHLNRASPSTDWKNCDVRRWCAGGENVRLPIALPNRVPSAKMLEIVIYVKLINCICALCIAQLMTTCTTYFAYIKRYWMLFVDRELNHNFSFGLVGCSCFHLK